MGWEDSFLSSYPGHEINPVAHLSITMPVQVGTVSFAGETGKSLEVKASAANNEGTLRSGLCLESEQRGYDEPLPRLATVFVEVGRRPVGHLPLQ